ncbi:MAG TPA: hypothetical protein VHB79_06490 [Polyangiaceae bacterium]|nr:hypothetical protein [Polyangiaceae bacterium]
MQRLLAVAGCLAALSLGKVVQAATPQPGATGAGATEPEGDATAAPASKLHGDGKLVGLISTPFGGNLDDPGYGFSIAAGFGWGKLPLLVGFDVMTAFLGDTRSLQYVQTGNTTTTIQLDRSDSIYYFDLSLRLEPIDWWVRPYLEGVIGTKILFTKYTLSAAGSSSATESSDSDWAGSVGWGLGVDLGLNKSGSTGLSLGVRRLSGARASFSREVAGTDGAVHYSSPTSAMFWMIGFVTTFGDVGTAR